MLINIDEANIRPSNSSAFIKTSRLAHYVTVLFYKILSKCSVRDENMRAYIVTNKYKIPLLATTLWFMLIHLKLRPSVVDNVVKIMRNF